MRILEDVRTARSAPQRAPTIRIRFSDSEVGSPRAALWVGAGNLAAAGAYQLTPFKDVCLKHCRS